MKRRVSGRIGHREPGQLETGTEDSAEHGLGAARPKEHSLGSDGGARHSAGVSDVDPALPKALAVRPG